MNLLSELSKIGVQMVLYSDSALHVDHVDRLERDSYRVVVAPPMRYIAWEQHWLPRQCAIDRVNLLHSPFNFGLPCFSSCPRVLTLHDAIDYNYNLIRLSALKRYRLSNLKSRAHLWIARTRADSIITVSEHAKKDLIDLLGIPEKKITVVFEAADPRFHVSVEDSDRERVRYKFELPRFFVLYVGGWEDRKNVSLLLRAFAAAAIDNMSLVMAGGRTEQITEFSRLAEDLNVVQKVRFLGFVDDVDLPALYSSAFCFVYPSQYEGFGLQLCEAMAVGCPVLAARATSLTEVLGGGGEHFDPFDPTELAILLRRVVCEATFRDDLVLRARTRSLAFSWKRAAEQTLSVYRSTLERS